MGIVPEKNDVDISKLFSWGQDVKITDDNGVEIMGCYIRLIGDADINRARVYALRNSAELRRRLKDPFSDEHLAYIINKDDVEKPNLIQAFIGLRGKEEAEKFAKEINLPFPKEPTSDASLEDQEKYQLELDSYPNRVTAELEKKVRAVLEVEQERLKKKSKDELYTDYQILFINDICEKTMYEDFKLACVYYGTFKDSTCNTKLFSSLEDVSNLPTTIKDQFIEGYASLELSSDFLKKLGGATPS